jgi:hypothetical protein
MGLFFEHPVAVPQDVIHTVMRQALLDPAPADVAAEAARRMQLLGSNDPRLAGAITTALKTSPLSPEQADQQAQTAAATLQSAGPAGSTGAGH